MPIKAFSSEVGTGSRGENASTKESGKHARGAQGHKKKRSRHQNPEASQHGSHHHEFEAAALHPGAEQGVAHDDEGRGKHQEWHGRKRLRRHALVEKAEVFFFKQKTAYEMPK